MSESDPKDKPAKGPATAGGGVPGGVQHDSRGNAVWQWAAESGRHLIDSTSRLLKRLEVPGLSVEGEEPEEEKKLKELQRAGKKKASGYNPYETPRPDSPGRPGVARDSAPHPAAGKPLSTPAKSAPPAVKPEPPRSWLGKVFKKD